CRAMRSAAQIPQTQHSFLHESAPKLVARLAADPVPSAHLCHRPVPLQQLPDESLSLFHGTGLPPRHRIFSSAAALHLLPISPVHSVTLLTGLYRSTRAQGDGTAGVLPVRRGSR